jgi:hypothetical protein
VELAGLVQRRVVAAGCFPSRNLSLACHLPRASGRFDSFDFQILSVPGTATNKAQSLISEKPKILAGLPYWSVQSRSTI